MRTNAQAIRNKFAVIFLAMAPLVPALAQDSIPPAGAAQIQALVQEKLNRTPAQRKMDSQIIYNAKLAAGQRIAPGLPDSFRPAALERSTEGLIHVDIDADVNNALLQAIRALRGRVESAFPQYKSVRAWIPLPAAETLAGRDDVHFVKPAAQGRTNPIALPSQRLVNIRAQLARALPAVEAGTNGGAIPNLGSSSGPGPDTNGVKAHGADLVHAAGIFGAGLKIGVLSDGVTSLANEQAANRLPAVTVIAGQSGDGPGPCPSTPMVTPPTCPDEGTALLEVVYSMAPAAQLYYATAQGGEAQFAANIKALQAAGCTIIVDDVTYGDEPVFQDGTVAQAVNSVTALGVMYFSSAANSGNLDSSTSGTWEGDFNPTGSTVSFPDPRMGIIHSFGATNYEVLTAKAQNYYAIQWSDPYSGASDDYDLYILDPTGATVEAFSNNTQSGSQPPIELINDSSSIVVNSRIVIVKVSGATRALHLDTDRGSISIGTAGNTFGHNAAASAFTVAAADVANAGGGIFTGGTANPPESFSSDGPRQIFFDPSGNPITPGNFLFATNGGTTLAKVDFMAADGVTTGVPQFPSFFGTSAAAPHAAAIAALIKSADPSLTNAQIKNILYTTSLNVSNFMPRTVGSGIVMANLGVAAVVAPPVISKSFGALTIPLSGSTSLSFSVTNPAANSVSVSGIGFTDTLPAGLVVSSPSGLTGSCGGGTIGATPASGSVTLTGATLAPGAVCNFSLNVTGIVAGVQSNSVTVASPLGNGNTANASVTVVAPPSITKTFSPDKFIPGGTTTVSFTITNPNTTVSLLGVAFTDSLPAGLLVTSPAVLTTNCIGTETANAGIISLSGASIAASGSCTLSTSVTAPEGIYNNSVQVTSSNGGTGNTSMARVYVATPPNLSKVFGELSIGSPASTTLTFTLTNPNHVVTLDELQFSDTLPTGLVISTPNGLTGSCGGGTITAPDNTEVIMLAGATLLPQTTCTFGVNVTSDGAALGYLTNTTSTVSSTEALPGAAASATIFIGNPLQITYAANPTAGETPLTITNSGASAGGNICVSLYAFNPNAQMVSCCSCQVAADALVTLGVNKDLTNNAVQTSVVIKLVGTTPGGACANSAGTQGTLANGAVASATTLQPVGITNIYNAVYQPFVPSTLSAAEYTQLANVCSATFGGGGLCSSCNPALRH